MVPQAADVAYFGYHAAAQLVLSVDGIALERRVLETLIDREDPVRSGRQGWTPKHRLILDDGVVRPRGGEDRTGSGGIVDQAGGARVGRAVVAERIQAGRVVIDAVAASEHEFPSLAGRIGEAEPWSEVVLASRVQRVDVLAHEIDSALAGNEYREALVHIEERPEVFPADAVVER